MVRVEHKSYQRKCKNYVTKKKIQAWKEKVGHNIGVLISL